MILFPTGCHIAGFRIEAVFAGEGENARQKPDQPAVVLDDSDRQIVIGDLSRDATERCKGMYVAADVSKV